MSKMVHSLKKMYFENEGEKNKKESQEQENGTIARKSKLIMSMEKTVSFEQNYILFVSGTQSEPDFKIGAALSDYSCIIYSVSESLDQICTLDHNKSSIVDIKFSPNSKNILYTANNGGQITACDLRTKGRVVAEFKDNTEDGKMKPLISFDISGDESLIVGGTEFTDGDAFMLFWDVRYNNNSKVDNNSNLLGGYWESHMDDITCLAFHPTMRDVLMSGSTDGLMNLFDLSQSSEHSALVHSLNTESSVDRLGWLPDDSVWCATHTHALQLWDPEDVRPYATFARSNLVMSQNDDPDNCYLVRFHGINSFGQPFLLAGSSTVKRENLRCLNVVNKRLEVCYELVGNKQIVRDSWMNEMNGCLVTAGEKSIINIWRPAESTSSNSQQNSNKLLTKINPGKDRDRHRTKPY